MDNNNIESTKTLEPIIPGNIYGNIKVLEKIKSSNGKTQIFRCQCTICGDILEKLQPVSIRRGSTKLCSCYTSSRNIEIGKTYGDLEVLKEYERTGNRIYYTCKCNKCGAIIERVGHETIQNGHNSKCDCNKTHGLVIGQVYGRLRLDEVDNSESINKYICTCTECNTQVKVSKAAIKAGGTSLCKCKGINIGQVYGNIKVLELIDLDYKYNAHKRYKCQCIKCGDTFEIISDVIKNGVTSLCSCNNKEINSAIQIGQVYGKLKVLSKVLDRKQYYHCLCTECNTEVDVSYSSIINYGSSQLCNCHKILPGKIYGDLIILKTTDRDNYFLCKSISTGKVGEVEKRRIYEGKANISNSDTDNKIKIGELYGRIIPLSYYTRDGRGYYRCKCSVCGDEFELRQDAILNGSTSKCSCAITRDRKIDETELLGQRFGDLEVIAYDHLLKGKGTFWKCKCHGICGGNEIIVSRNSLINGDIKHCRDCYLAELASKRDINPIGYTVKINDKTYYVEEEYIDTSKTNSLLFDRNKDLMYKCIDTETQEEVYFNIKEVRIALLRPKEYSYYRDNKASISDDNILDNFYLVWRNMRSRVLDTTYISYDRYGKRNIKIYPEWLIYDNFYNDMYESYVEHVTIYGLDNTSLDRIDNDGNYCKENCRWATWEEQIMNRELSKKYKYAGEYYNINELIEKFGDPGLNYNMLSYRLKVAGYNPGDTINIKDSVIFMIKEYRKDMIKPIHFIEDKSSVKISFSNLNNTKLP